MFVSLNWKSGGYGVMDDVTDFFIQITKEIGREIEKNASKKDLMTIKEMALDGNGIVRVNGV